jgi:hypothetical protein
VKLVLTFAGGEAVGAERLADRRPRGLDLATSDNPI